MDQEKPKRRRTAANVRAEAKYEEKTTTKRVRFNNETERDLLQKAESLPNFSGWVKEKLREME